MLRIIKFIKIAYQSITENKFRAFLTMLGIIIGVASVIIMSSVGQGAQSYILGSVSSFGSNLIYIQSGSGDQNVSSSFLSIDKVKYKDYLAVKKLSYLENVSAFLAYDAIITYGNKNLKISVLGTTPEYSKVLNFYTNKGRFLENGDIISAERVVVLGSKVVDDLFDGKEPLGQQVKIKNQPFKVIGVMETQGGNAFEDYDNMIFVPVTALQTYINGADYVNTIVASVKGSMDDAIENIREFMRKRHNISNPENDLSKDDFGVLSQQQALDIFNSIASVLTLFLLAIICISLVVGGIGIMNIMFVVVNQRTREIGLRKAIGATNKDIMLQFLIEAIVITFLGGLIGIGIGMFFSFLISLVISRFQVNWDFSIPLNSVLISSGFSVVIGLAFGLYPARKASRLSPIEALRYE